MQTGSTRARCEAAAVLPRHTPVRTRGARRCRSTTALLSFALVAGCSQPAPPPAPVQNTAPNDSQHAGITEPHGDHTPHHGGLVLMNGDLHYEVVIEPDGRYEVWFTNAVRTELPAAIASDVRVETSRPEGPVEAVPLAIDEAGESWVGQGRPVSGEGVMVKVSYAIRGEPYEVEIPYVR